MSTLYYESELYHHGIRGQKWGKRNGPPYPLGSGSKRSSAERGSNSSGSTRKLRAKKAAAIAGAAAGATAAGVAGHKAYKQKKYDKENNIINERHPKMADDKGSNNVDSALKVTNSAKAAINSAKNLNDEYKKKQAQSSIIDPSTMTDAELKQAVSRMNLEQQYTNLSVKKINKGNNYVDTILDYGGSIAAVTASTVAIISALKHISK